MQPYPKYKDSGVAWLGEIPDSWIVRRLRIISLVRSSGVDKKTNSNEVAVLLCNYVDVYKNDYITSSIDFMKATATKEEIQKLELEKDDIIITKDSENWQDIAVPAFVIDKLTKTVCAYHLTLIRPFSNKVKNKFLYRAFSSAPIANQLYVCAKGVTRFGLTLGDIKNTVFPIPLIKEQNQIASYLDLQTDKITKFIKAKQQLIKLLQEQKQVIINEAVTKGINPNVKLKDSDVDWLGEIPEHWENMKIKQVVIFNPSKSESIKNTDLNTNVTFLPMEKISTNWKITCDIKLPLSEVYQGFTYFQRNDVVLAKITPCFENGKGAFLNNLDSKFGFGTTELYVLRPLKNIMGEYLSFIFRSYKFLNLGTKHMSGAAGQQRVQKNFIKNFEIGLPSIKEQKKIVAFIEDKSNLIDKAISRIKKEITLIEEYRNRLIADVVTGKVDIRSVTVPKLKATSTELEQEYN
jgi:type I restriction enzyme S subunit